MAVVCTLYIIVKVYIIFDILHLYRQEEAAIQPSVMFTLTSTIVTGFVIVAFIMFAAWQLRREALRARVELNEVGLTVTNWRGRVKTVAWDQIEQVRLRFPPLRRNTLLQQCAIYIFTSRQRLAIPYLIGKRDTLITELVTRAGLQLTNERRGRRVYTRG